MIRALRWAAGFLSVLPVAPRGAPAAGEFARAAACFPLVGALVGLAGWGVDLAAAAGRLPDLARGWLVLAALALLTRGLHLDGLADTADGLASLRDRAGMLAVMRDPHIGAAGATALVLVLFLQATALAGMPPAGRGAALLGAAVASRLTMTAAARLFRYARAEGAGAELIGRVPAWAALFALASAVAVAALAGGRPVVGLLLVGTGVGLLVAAFVRLRLGGLTGDVLGAAGELAQTAALVWAAAG